LGRRFALVQQDGVDVAFEVVDGDEGQVGGEGQGFGVGDADEERSGEAGAAGDGDGVEVGEGDAGLARAARTTGTMARRCSRLASSGTTPP
jgi:hypothetical protein